MTQHKDPHSHPLKPSPFITVLVMWSSLKGATPRAPRRSLAGLTSRLDPVMVILGSLGGRTITTTLRSGMERHMSSPKHLTHREEVEEMRERTQDGKATALMLRCWCLHFECLLCGWREDWRTVCIMVRFVGKNWMIASLRSLSCRARSSEHCVHGKMFVAL